MSDASLPNCSVLVLFFSELHQGRHIREGVLDREGLLMCHAQKEEGHRACLLSETNGWASHVSFEAAAWLSMLPNWGMMLSVAGGGRI